MSAVLVVGQRYRLIEELGRGGMGSVWRLMLTAAIRRPVTVEHDIGQAIPIAVFDQRGAAIATAGVQVGTPLLDIAGTDTEHHVSAGQ